MAAAAVVQYDCRRWLRGTEPHDMYTLLALCMRILYMCTHGAFSEKEGFKWNKSDGRRKNFHKSPGAATADAVSSRRSTWEWWSAVAAAVFRH